MSLSLSLSGTPGIQRQLGLVWATCLLAVIMLDPLHVAVRVGCENIVVLVRVRLGDLVLAAVAVAGILAGLALTVAARVGVTGPILIGAGIVAAAAMAVSAMRGQLGPLRNQQVQQRDRLESIWVVPVQAVSEVDPFQIGVFPSALAETTQRTSPIDESAYGTVPPYVGRGVDAALRRALEEPALAGSRRLVVLRGDPKSGKSRSLWEAVRRLPGRKLLAVAAPDPFADASAPLFAPLATLADLDRPVSRLKGLDLVIWVDNAHTHLWHGLSRDTLRRLPAGTPPLSWL